MGIKTGKKDKKKAEKAVSIQLISPTSGDKIEENCIFTKEDNVSIQLISPTSGDMIALSPSLL